MWKSRCVITQKRFGGHIILTLTRWDAQRPPALDNLVLMMQNEATKLAEQGTSAFAPEIVQRVEKRLAWAREVLRLDEGGDDNDGIDALKKSEWRRANTLQQKKSEQVQAQRLRLAVGNLLLFSVAWFTQYR
jgi:hypothetical protein